VISWAFEFALAVLGLIVAGGLAAFVFSWIAVKALRRQRPRRKPLCRPELPPKVTIGKAPTPPKVPFDELVHLEEIHLAEPLPPEPPRHRPPLKYREDPKLTCGGCGFIYRGKRLRNRMRCPFCHGYTTSVRKGYRVVIAQSSSSPDELKVD